MQLFFSAQPFSSLNLPPGGTVDKKSLAKQKMPDDNNNNPTSQVWKKSDKYFFVNLSQVLYTLNFYTYSSFLAIFPGARLIFSSSNRRNFISPLPSWSTERRPLHRGISRIYTIKTMRSKKKSPSPLLLELRYAVREMLLRGSF